MSDPADTNQPQDDQEATNSQSTASSLHLPEEEIQKMADKILAESFTKPQLLRRLRVLKDFINFRLFKLNQDEIKLSVGQQISEFIALHQHDILELNLLRQEGNWLVSLGEDFYAKFNKDNVNLLFDQIEKGAIGAKHIILYLPVELPEANQLEIGQWFKTNIGVNTTFETNFDANLIALIGASIGNCSPLTNLPRPSIGTPSGLIVLPKRNDPALTANVWLVLTNISFGLTLTSSNINTST